MTIDDRANRVFRFLLSGVLNTRDPTERQRARDSMLFKLSFREPEHLFSGTPRAFEVSTTNSSVPTEPEWKMKPRS